MSGFIAWFAGNRVAANVMMVIILASGIISLPSIKKELFPSITLDVVEIEVAYPGADPAAVEEAVCLRLEEAVEGLDNIKSIEAFATSSSCTVYVTAAPNGATERLQSAIENRIDAITSLPEQAEWPTITTVAFNEQVISVVISGQVDERTLIRIGERIREDITTLPGVTLAKLEGTRVEQAAIALRADLNQKPSPASPASFSIST